MAENIREKIIKQLTDNGIRFTKKTSSGGRWCNDIYDKRIAYSIDDINELLKEGFLINEDLGAFLFIALLNN